MLSTPLICCSIGVATDCSTVCASAPTKVVCTCTSGGAIAGNSDMGRLRMVIAPTITVSSEITMATIGRLMKNFDTLASCLGRFSGANPYASSVSDLHQPFDHDPPARLQAFTDYPHFPYSFSDGHRPDTDLVVAANYRDLIAALKLDHRSLRNQQSAVLRSHRRANSSVGAWTKKVVGVRENTGNPNGAGRGIYLTIGEVDASSPFMDSSVGEQQFRRYVPLLVLHALLGGKPAT